MTDRSDHGALPEDLLDIRDDIDDVKITDEERDDLPVTPPESQPIAGEFLDNDAPETIDERIMQEEPDPHSAYGAPLNESGLDDVPLESELNTELDELDIPAERAAIQETDQP